MSDQYRDRAGVLAVLAIRVTPRWPWQTALRPGVRVGLVHAGNLGDVVATLPMAGAVKAACPSAEVLFIGRRYTEPGRARQPSCR